MEIMIKVSGHFIPVPPLCNADITGPIVEQSSKNCTRSRAQHAVASKDTLGNVSRNDQQSCIMSALVSDRDGQDSSRDSNVPWWLCSEPQHAGREQRPSLFHATQCPVRASTLYLPDNILACVVAFSTSQGEDPQVVKIGWHFVRPKYSVFTYLREGRQLALVLKSASQY